MVRLKDIAEKVNVSTATVSNVLNGTGNISDETRKRVMEVVKDLDYQPNNIAKSLKMKRTNTIGVIVEDITIFNTPQIIDGINEYAAENGWSIILTNMRLYKTVPSESTSKEYCRKMVPNAVRDLISKQVDGIIYIGMHPRDMTGIFPEVKKPIVCTYSYTTEPDTYSINYNNESTAYKATQYLIGKGHKKIALISGLIDSAPSRGRFNGYYKALEDNNIPFNPDLVKTGDWELMSGYLQAKNLFEKEYPTAILAMNDLMAAGVYEACKELQLSIPEDVSVMGIDDREMAFYLSPKLTTMKLPLVQMGKFSMETISTIINNSIMEPVNLLECKLIERESVGQPKEELID